MNILLCYLYTLKSCTPCDEIDCLSTFFDILLAYKIKGFITLMLNLKYVFYNHLYHDSTLINVCIPNSISIND